ncbi:lysylphosphatidylglycerol synthase transmembrane domain-containing protein [Micromonospora sp. NPDC002296]|uniref:lysylphosphatidylglycerol synthase transmembrane domain-containing protein n=1 Tax=Micromonospora sp. NPDC002296 TaxID=3154271 RepID=UPI003328D030
MSETRSASRKRWDLVVRVVLVATTVISLWWFLRGLDARAFSDTLARANVPLLVVAVLLNLVAQVVRAGSWVVMLGPRHQPPAGRLLRYEFAAQAASSISPARAGELLRLWMLKHEGVPVGITGALIVLKKTIGAACMGLLALATPFVVPGLPGWVTGFVVGVSALMLVLLGLLVVTAYRARANRLPKMLHSMVDGMYFLKDRLRFSSASCLILVGETIDVAAAYAVMRALHIGLSVAAVVLVVFFIDFSNVLPGAPANLGTFEVGAVYCLSLLHVAPDAALGFALLFHAQQVLPQVVVGLPLQLHFLSVRRKQPGTSGPGTIGTVTTAPPLVRSDHD